MKKTIGITLPLMVAMLFGACSGIERPGALCTITGTWDRQGPAEVSLFYTVSGRLEKLASYTLQGDKKFSFAFTPSAEGFYVIGTSLAAAGVKDKYTFYFKPGDHLNVDVNDSTYVLIGKNTKENAEMVAWHNYIAPIEKEAAYKYNKTYVEFFPMLEEKTATEYKAASTGNKTFDQSFAKFRKFDMMQDAIQFLSTPRTAHPQGADFIDYYKNINLDELTSNTDVLSYPYGYRMLSGAAYAANRVKGLPPYKMDELIAAVKNDTIKGEVFLSYLSGVKDYPTLEDMKAQYGQYVLTEDQQARLKTATERIAALQNEMGAGKLAVNFTHKDRNGKSVSLSDFKNKVVYVDVWATWCGPCRKELPYLKELEKKFHGNKDIVFIGVSIDEAKDQQKWKEFLTKEQLPGIQLFGGNGWNSDIAKLYQIKAIPRFMLFDKQGNVVSTEAPRPSSKEILPLLNKLLK